MVNILKKIGKYSLLLSIKESYLFSKNIFGLLVHPFKTLRSLFREKDYSQEILVIFGFPVVIILLGYCLIRIGRFIIQAPSEWGSLARYSLIIFGFMAVAAFIYVVYWLFKVLSVKRGRE